jgi:hypothetical protein
MVLMREMPIRAAAKILGEHDTRLWRVLLRYVDAARAKEDHSPGAPGGGGRDQPSPRPSPRQQLHRRGVPSPDHSRGRSRPYTRREPYSPLCRSTNATRSSSSLTKVLVKHATQMILAQYQSKGGKRHPTPKGSQDPRRKRAHAPMWAAGYPQG